MKKSGTDSNLSLHPRHRKKQLEKKSKRPLLIGLLFLLIIIGAYTIYSAVYSDDTPITSQEVVVNQNLPEEKPKSGQLKKLSGEEFRDLYNTFAYPNTEFISDDAVITGNAKTDIHIRQMAEKRGYIRRSAPVQDTFREVQPNMLLQERASGPWLEMQKTAKADNIFLNLTAAYRSATEQRSIFIERLADISLTPELIISGFYDEKLDEVLATTAIPGYSRHHTGYTIDIGCENQPAIAFENTVCFDWLSKDNYKKAKEFGWIPSYPEGAGQQGPEPETWEYVWVGIDALTD